MYQNRILNYYISIHTARKALESMMEIRNELGDIKQALENLHQNTNNTEIGK